MASNIFRKKLESRDFVVTAEIIPGRGANDVAQETAMQNAIEIWNTNLVDAISLTDAPGGNPALLADNFAADLEREGINTLVHMTCKDRNRNQLENQLYSMQRARLENLLCMTGDFTGQAFGGKARPVFDLDSVTLLQMISAFNDGMPYKNFRGETRAMTPGDFFAGAVVSPYKWTEAETLTQFYKLKKKVYAGAKFIICQVGYSTRKLQEMMMLARDAGIDVPIIANIYVLNAGHGRSMNKGLIPGCDVTDDFLELLVKQRDESDDKGKEAAYVRAAKMIAIAKGLGCAGVHIGGFGVDENAVVHILDMAKNFEQNWRDYISEINYAPKNAFYYYKQDESTGLNLNEENPKTEDFFVEVKGNYKLSRLAHKKFFTPGQGFNKTFSNREKNLEEKKGRLRKHGLEHLGKVKMYDCMDCGDCGLYAVGYTCPMVHCPKCQRNGPCGGSHNGWCEVYPNQQRCIWFTAYHRLKKYDEQDELQSYIVPPNDWTNFAKSPWGANVTGIDGYAKRIWLDEEDKDLVEANSRQVKNASEAGSSSANGADKSATALSAAEENEKRD